MKKILSLVMALAMVLGCFAMAETTSILDADMDELLVLDRESSLNDWEGEWVLVAAYITADFAEEYDVEQSGLLAVPENAATLTITALKDATANDKVLGTMVDVASYIHDHTYDLSGELTFSLPDTPRTRQSSPRRSHRHRHPGGGIPHSRLPHRLPRHKFPPKVDPRQPRRSRPNPIAGIAGIRRQETPRQLRRPRKPLLFPRHFPPTPGFPRFRGRRGAAKRPAIAPGIGGFSAAAIPVSPPPAAETPLPFRRRR